MVKMTKMDVIEQYIFECFNALKPASYSHLVSFKTASQGQGNRHLDLP